MVASGFSVDSLHHMMLYAWRLWPVSASLTSASPSDANAPLERLAIVLMGCISKAEKAGLHREYRPNLEKTLLPRGRILVSQTIHLKARQDQRVAVQADEFSLDCPANQAIKEAARLLIGCKLDPGVKDGLRAAQAKLRSVSDVSLSSRQVDSALRRARRSEYRMALSIAVLIKQHRLFGGSDSSYSIDKATVDDESLFRRLYESSLREFFRFQLPDLVVTGRQYKWQESQNSVVPVMQTDINVEGADEVVVIDAKCTPRVLTTRLEFDQRQTLNSGHLYQMFSYMAHARATNPLKRISGILLYPEYEASVDQRVDTAAGPLRVKTINFRNVWDDVSQDLLNLLKA